MMKPVGQIIKDIRLKKKISLYRLSVITKIRKEFLSAIEDGDWDLLPEYPVVSGFVKNIAESLNMNVQSTIALLRRDYPPKDLRINPKPDVVKGFSWNPKLTFWMGITAVFLLTSGYLIFQYLNFIKPPNLVVDAPKDGQVIKEKNVTVSGLTDSDVVVKVDNQPVLVSSEGKFSTEIEISETTKEISIIARSRSGKETSLKRKIEVETKK
jgi:cytoskeletal protein RodZ